MKVVALRLRFALHGCRSLKDKRRRLRGLRDRFGKQTGMAVCESAAANSLRSAEWTFVAAASSPTVVAQMLDEVGRYAQSSVDAELISEQRSSLASDGAEMEASVPGSEMPEMPAVRT